ncbi:Spt20 family-domain-containing protein [Cantharellus anzutake]|uniref:Spt20 family-domain-containing protein n=1 Tax=Cantharellus anzutake TaxID=1750568 RepID=UPI00190556CC|nr:Spt20 family-domain-containing protein [Cantharellus anzutake]KAF8329544.1 Spt20 family-domain-containing protein [Cantharellus anzutake]
MASLYNRALANEQILKALEKDPPSLTVHLYKDNWRFNQSGTCLYHTPIASLLDDIRAHRVPVDFLDIFKQAKVPFYSGCLIVELFDHRDSADPNEAVPPQHIVLWPTAEATWAELCSLNARDGGMWTDTDALNFEAKLLLQNAPDLCLDPDPLVSKVANAALLVTTPPLSLPFKRKRSADDAFRDEEAKAQRDRMMKLMNPRAERGFHAR